MCRKCFEVYEAEGRRERFKEVEGYIYLYIYVCKETEIRYTAFVDVTCVTFFLLKNESAERSKLLPTISAA